MRHLMPSGGNRGRFAQGKNPVCENRGLLEGDQRRPMAQCQTRILFLGWQPASPRPRPWRSSGPLAPVGVRIPQVEERSALQ